MFLHPDGPSSSFTYSSKPDVVKGADIITLIHLQTPDGPAYMFERIVLLEFIHRLVSQEQTKLRN